MKRLLITLVGMSLLQGTGWSQEQEVPELARLDSERARIGVVRQQKNAELDIEDAACQSKFAVTDCQNQVGARRRQMLAELKSREVELNARERLLKGMEQLQRSEQKAVDRIAREAQAQADADSAALSDKRAAQAEKILNHQQQANPAGARTTTGKTTSALDPQEVEKNRAAFAEKQQALEKRRKDRDQRILDHGNGGPPLPLRP